VELIQTLISLAYNGPEIKLAVRFAKIRAEDNFI